MSGVAVDPTRQSSNGGRPQPGAAEPYVIVKLANIKEDLLRKLYHTSFSRSDDISEQVWETVFEALSVHDPSLRARLSQEPVIGFRRVFDSMSWEEMENLAARRVASPKESTVPEMPDLRTYFRIDFKPSRPERGRVRDTRSALERWGMTAETVADELVRCHQVERAHVGCTIGEPPSLRSQRRAERADGVEPPGRALSDEEVDEARARAFEAIGLPELQALYREADGVGTRADGRHTRFVDIEQGWEYRHPDLPKITGLIPISGVNRNWIWSNSEGKWVNVGLHGLMTLGLIAGQNDFGIAPAATPFLASEWKKPAGQPWTENTAEAIVAACTKLQAGDVIVIQGQQVFDGKNLPVEADPLIFDAIVTAYHLGITVVEAAGNNQTDPVDLDTVELPPVWHGRQRIGFNPDSGAIVVGAGENQGASEERANDGSQPFVYRHTSNFGNRVDCFADGDDILVLDLPGAAGAVEGNYEIVPGGGTSSATAIIAGIVLVLQGIYRDAYGPSSYIHPWDMRDMLKAPENGTKAGIPATTEAAGLFKSNGSDEPSAPIGVMPNLSKIHSQGALLRPIAERQERANRRAVEEGWWRIGDEVERIISESVERRVAEELEWRGQERSTQRTEASSA